MRPLLIPLLLVSLLLPPAFVSAAEPQSGKIKVLLITGDDVKPHPWREMAEATRDVLVNSGKFDVMISESPTVLGSAGELARYDLIFLSFYNAKPFTLADEAKQNLLNFVKGGKGFALSHLSSASFKEWEEFRKMVGRYWVMKVSGHGPRGIIKVKIADRSDPVTKGMENFETDDELYAKLQGTEPIHVLATADSDWSKQTEPLAFTLSYGKGRVFQECFGHDRAAIMNPGVAKLIVRGCEWAAKGKVE